MEKNVVKWVHVKYDVLETGLGDLCVTKWIHIKNYGLKSGSGNCFVTKGVHLKHHRLKIGPGIFCVPSMGPHQTLRSETWFRHHFRHQMDAY